MSKAVPFCVLRRFRDGDQKQIKDLITEATMEKVGSFFWGAVFSEALLQICVLAMAVSFIFIGIPFKYCLFAIPFAVVLLYCVIWMGHWVKANSLHEDLNNIHANYLHDNSTTFLVAEVFGRAGEAELASVMNKVKKIEYNFYTEREFEVGQINTNGLSPFIVGSVAVTKSMHRTDWAWIRRMAVLSTHRRRQLASNLLTSAIEFCKSKNYTGIELQTTECHNEARELYYRNGFESLDTSQKSYFGLGSTQLLNMYMRLTDTTKEKNTMDCESAKDV